MLGPHVRHEVVSKSTRQKQSKLKSTEGFTIRRCKDGYYVSSLYDKRLVLNKLCDEAHWSSGEFNS